MHRATPPQSRQPSLTNLTPSQQRAVRSYAQTTIPVVNAGQRAALLAAAVKEDIKVLRKNMAIAARLGVHRMHPEFEKVRRHMSAGWFEAMTLMALETGQPCYRLAALEWDDLDFETHQLRSARTGWQVMSPELELHLDSLPAQYGKKVFDPAELQVDKAWARMFIKAGLVPVRLLQRRKQDLPTRASFAGEAPAGQQQI
ncbi:hypothetical protein ACFPOE_01940 [Caenimonas terrae]|uniref:Uncharacterized protein n=1 Tax=Caenimonas terrae TaxID=696074 RepID=A0ABW0NBJ9_9BURK